MLPPPPRKLGRGSDPRFYRQRTPLPIPTVHNFKNLGFVVDDKLSFKRYVSHIHLKACKLIGKAFRIFHFRDSSLYLKFYFSYVLAVVDFCSVLYAHVIKYNEDLL